jgi:hypothetical protein
MPNGITMTQFDIVQRLRAASQADPATTLAEFDTHPPLWDAAANEIEKERADAARYRWLIEECKYMPWGRLFPGINAGKGIDEAIDEQIAIQKSEN